MLFLSTRIRRWWLRLWMILFNLSHICFQESARHLQSICKRKRGFPFNMTPGKVHEFYACNFISATCIHGFHGHGNVRSSVYPNLFSSECSIHLVSESPIHLVSGCPIHLVSESPIHLMSESPIHSASAWPWPWKHLVIAPIKPSEICRIYEREMFFLQKTQL